MLLLDPQWLTCAKCAVYHRSLVSVVAEYVNVSSARTACKASTLANSGSCFLLAHSSAAAKDLGHAT